MDPTAARTTRSQPRATRLRELLGSPRLEFLIEAHSGISAVIAEEAGFAGIWASGFSMAAALGLPDNNEASLAEILYVLECMADRTTIPILADGDTGYGNYNNVRRLVAKLEQRGVSGVCIEDKLFPKRNSFVRGLRQPLADSAEFCGKIKAAKDAQRDEQFVVVARVEALVAGWGCEEALARAQQYCDAGADAVLVHSVQRTAAEILGFMRLWNGRVPILAVPTSYYATPTHVLSDAGVSVCIWANQLVRASVAAMQRVATRIHSDANILAAESIVSPMSEVLRLQGERELEDAERKYLPRASVPRVILLAASQGAELGALTRDTPKAMLRVGGRPLLSHVLAPYRSLGLTEVVVVRGFRKELVDVAGVRYVDNDEHETSGEAWSLWHARESLEGPCLLGYGDVLYRKHVPALLVESSEDFAICVDTQVAPQRARGRGADFVVCSEPHSRGCYHRRVLLQRVLPATQAEHAHGEWMGALRMSARGAAVLRDLLARFQELGTLRGATIPDLLNALVEDGNDVRVDFTTGHWLDVNTLDDLVAAGEML